MRLGQGREAEVVTWADGYVLKLFWPEFSKADVEWEAKLAQQAWLAGAPTPRVVDILEVESHWGIVYERIYGLSLTEFIQSDPRKIRFAAQILGALQREVHSRPGGGLPSQRQRLIGRIVECRLDGQTRDALLAHLDTLPGGSSLCHGDFHPENVIVGRDRVYVVDWPNASYGNPLADIAWTSLLIRYSTLPPDLPARKEIMRMRRSFHQTYLKHYFAQSWLDQTSLDAWMPIVAAARLREGIEGEEPRLMKLIEEGLKNVR